LLGKGVEVREGLRPLSEISPYYGERLKKKSQREAKPLLKNFLPLSLERRGGYRG
jgi:hypothetical protein